MTVAFLDFTRDLALIMYSLEKALISTEITAGTYIYL